LLHINCNQFYFLPFFKNIPKDVNVCWWMSSTNLPPHQLQCHKFLTVLTLGGDKVNFLKRINTIWPSTDANPYDTANEFRWLWCSSRLVIDLCSNQEDYLTLSEVHFQIPKEETLISFIHPFPFSWREVGSRGLGPNWVAEWNCDCQVWICS
jgi:hypothetical protein